MAVQVSLCVEHTRTNRIPSHTWLTTKPSEIVFLRRKSYVMLAKAPEAILAKRAHDEPTALELTRATDLCVNFLMSSCTKTRQKHSHAGMFTSLPLPPSQAHVFPSGRRHRTALPLLARAG